MEKTWRGGWRFDSEDMTMQLDGTAMSGDRVKYEVELDAFRNSAEILDSIAQITKKNWATPEIVFGFVVALDDLLDLQANVCSFGSDRTIDPLKVIRTRFS